MADWPLDNADAGLVAPGRQLWRLDERPRVEVTVGAAAGVLALADPRQAQATALLGARRDAEGRAWPASFAFSPDDGAALEPAPSPMPPWGAPSGGDGGLPQTDAIAALDPASRAEHLVPTQALLFTAGAPGALYALRTALGVLEVRLPGIGGGGSSNDWLKLGVVARAGVELAPWSAAVATSPLGFAAPSAAGPVFVRLPRLPGLPGEIDAAPPGARSVGGVAIAGNRWLAPVRAGEGLALLSRTDRWAADWGWVEVEGAPGWPEPTSPAGALAAPVADGRDDVFWVGREGYLGWSPAEARAVWTPWPAPFRAIPIARPWRSGDGVLWQQGEEPAADGARLAFRALRFGGASGEAHAVRNPHFSAGGWTYASSGRPARWLRPWDRMVDDEQLRIRDGAVLAPLLGFDDRSGDPRTLLAEIEGDGVHAGALIRGEQPGLVRAVLKQHRSLNPIEELGAAFRIGRLDDLQAVRVADRLLVAHRDEPGDYARAYSWRIVAS